MPELRKLVPAYGPWPQARPLEFPFDIPALSPEVLDARHENPLLRPRVGGFAGHRPEGRKHIPRGERLNQQFPKPQASGIWHRIGAETY